MAFTGRTGWAPKDALPGGNVAVDAGFRQDHHALSNLDMVGKGGLPRHHHVIARGTRAGNPHLAGHDIVLADLAVMGDLDEIVDFRALANARGLKSPSIDGRAGADFNVVAYVDVSQLRDLDIAAFLLAITEPIGADDRIGVDGDSVAQDHPVVEHDVRMKRHVVAEAAIAADDRAGKDTASCPQSRPLSDNGQGTNTRFAANPNGRMDDRAGINARSLGEFLPAEMLSDGNESGQGLGDFDETDVFGNIREQFREILGQSGGKNHGRRLACINHPSVAFAFHERDIAWPSFAHRPGGCYGPQAIPVDFTVDQGSELLNGRLHGNPFLP